MSDQPKKAKTRRVAPGNGWTAFADRWPDEHHDVIVTNNMNARDAHGRMSHVWIVWPQMTEHDNPTFDSVKGEIIGFLHNHERVRNLTHWHPLPEPPEPSETSICGCEEER
jgi:hypothetical protein